MTNTGIIYVVQVFQACRMQILWGHRGFHPDFRIRLRKPSKLVWQSHSPCWVLLRGWFVKPWKWTQRCTEGPRKLKMPGYWNICGGSCRQWMKTVQERGHVGCNQQGLTGLLKPFGAHISAQPAMAAGCASTGFNICLDGFKSCFSLAFHLFRSSSLLQW